MVNHCFYYFYYNYIYYYLRTRSQAQEWMEGSSCSQARWESQTANPSFSQSWSHLTKEVTEGKSWGPMRSL